MLSCHAAAFRRVAAVSLRCRRRFLSFDAAMHDVFFAMLLLPFSAHADFLLLRHDAAFHHDDY